MGGKSAPELIKYKYEQIYLFVFGDFWGFFTEKNKSTIQIIYCSFLTKIAKAMAKIGNGAKTREAKNCCIFFLQNRFLCVFLSLFKLS